MAKKRPKVIEELTSTESSDPSPRDDVRSKGDGLRRDKYGTPSLSKKRSIKNVQNSEHKSRIVRGRLEQVKQYLVRGVPAPEYLSTLSDEWGISERVVYLYIARAREEIESERNRIEEVKHLLSLYYTKDQIFSRCLKTWSYLTEARCERHPPTEPDKECPDCVARVDKLEEYINNAIEVAQEEMSEIGGMDPTTHAHIATVAWVEKYRQAERDYIMWRGKENKLREAMEELEIQIAEETLKFNELEIEDKKERTLARKPLTSLERTLSSLEDKYSRLRSERVDAEVRWREYRIRLDKIKGLEQQGHAGNQYNIDARQQTVNISQPSISDQINNLLAAPDPKRLTVGEPLTSADIDEELAELLKDESVSGILTKYLTPEDDSIVDAEFIPKKEGEQDE